MDNGHRSPARLLAPVALAVSMFAVLFVVATSGGSDEQPNPNAGAAQEARDLGGDKAGNRESRREEKQREADEEESEEDVYVVEEGDTLGGIAESTGVPVERLQELNPGLDQFSLVAGQEIKLR